MFLTYGRTAQGALAHISEAPSGRACGLTCPFCGGPLVARKGRILAHHFAHLQTTCRPQVAGEEDLIPSYEGFYLMGLTRVQQRTLHRLIEAHGPRPFLAAGLPTVTRKALVEKGCLSVWEQPNRFERLELAGRLTAKGLAFDGGLTLLEFARLMEAAFERAEARLEAETDEPLAGTARELLAQEIARLKQTSLYFLEIETGQGTLHKIGLTRRRLPERLAEIAQFVSSQTTLKQITPLYRLEGVAYVEGYFKAKYSDYRHPLGQATEYFEFGQAAPAVGEEMAALAQAVKAGLSPRPRPTRPSRRPRFRAIFDRYAEQWNEFRQWYDPYLLLVEVVNLEARCRFADWLWFRQGKSFEALGELQKGDVLEFNAAIDGAELKRPTKLETLERGNYEPPYLF